MADLVYNLVDDCPNIYGPYFVIWPNFVYMHSEPDAT